MRVVKMGKKVKVIIGIAVVGGLLFLGLPSYPALDDLKEHTPESSLSATWTLEEPDSKDTKDYVLTLPVPAFNQKLVVSEILI
jgi:hypothetical protein